MQNTNKDLQDSGLYNTPFYTTINIPYDEIDIENIGWNRELHKKYSLDKDDLVDLSEDEIDDRVNEDFYQSAFMYNYYRKVEKYDYDEEDAYKCNLIPLTLLGQHEDSYLLSLGGCGMDLSPKLDAYFFLQTGKMDPASIYFRQKDYFKSLIPTEIFNTIEDKFGEVII